MYFIAHVLPPELNLKVLTYKLKMKDKYGCGIGLKSPAHITLIPPFWMNMENEPALISGLNELASTQHLFNITTQGFNCFKPKTIFIQPQLTPGLLRLKSATDDFIHNHPEFNAKTDNREFHPHITIATRDLQKKDFAEAWPLFENKSFNEAWEVRSISLLCHNRKDWDVIHTSAFSK
jgi:2'-5' RNA ligase